MTWLYGLTESDLYKGAGLKETNDLPRWLGVFDIETHRHLEMTERLGHDQKIAVLENITEYSDLVDFAASEGILLGNRKDPDKVRAHIIAHFQGIIEKAALKAYGNQIYAIGIADLAGGNPRVWCADDKHDEGDVLRGFIEYLASKGPCVLAGFNIRGFDLPTIRIRAAALAIKLPWWWPETVRRDRYETSWVFDAMDVLHEGTCDQWLRMFGLPPKTGSGANIANMTPKQVAQYCADDVERERLLIQRLAKNNSMVSKFAPSQPVMQ